MSPRSTASTGIRSTGTTCIATPTTAFDATGEVGHGKDATSSRTSTSSARSPRRLGRRVPFRAAAQQEGRLRRPSFRDERHSRLVDVPAPLRSESEGHAPVAIELRMLALGYRRQGRPVACVGLAENGRGFILTERILPLSNPEPGRRSGQEDQRRESPLRREDAVVRLRSRAGRALMHRNQGRRSSAP